MNEQQIEDWKKQYGDVYALPVEDKTAYLRAPNMVDFKRAFSAMQQSGDVAFGESMLAALWLGGDEAIKQDDSYFFPARKALVDFFNYEDAVTTPLENGKVEINIAGEKCIIRCITRDDLKIAEKKNPGNKPFVTQEKLFERIMLEGSDAYKDRNYAAIRMPLYAALETLQNKKVAVLKKL